MTYTLTREEASRMLGVSTRTVDRHISSGKIRSKRDGKVILLHADDIKKHQEGGIQKDFEILETAPKPTIVPSISYDARSGHNEILHAIENTLREKDALIQELTFKIGKLETEIDHSIPKLEYKKTVLALEEAHHNRVHDIDMMTKSRQDIEAKLKKEQLISTVLLIVVFLVVVVAAFLIFHFFSLAQGV